MNQLEKTGQSISDVIGNAITVKGKEFGAMLVHEFATTQTLRLLSFILEADSKKEIEMYCEMIAECLSSQSAQLADDLDLDANQVKEVFPLVDAMMKQIEQAEQKL